MSEKPSIAFLGTRGIPANYGGFETFTEEVGLRLAKKDYPVTVYCRPTMNPEKLTAYQGVRLKTLPTIKHKYLDTIVHAFLSVWHVAFSRHKIVYMCNAINSVFTIIPRLMGKIIIINVNGLEWKRAKWNRWGKWAYQVSEWLATKLAHVIISDSQAIQDYYHKRFKRDTVFISYGANIKNINDDVERITKLGLQRRGYFLYVSRLEHENNPHIIVKAFEKTKVNYPLVIVGDAPYGKPFIQQLRATDDPRIRFLGSRYGADYVALQRNAFIYFHGNEVGGTNPALLEAMGYGNCVIANGVHFNREVLGDAGVCFEPGNSDDLKEKIEQLVDQPEQIEIYRQRAAERIRRHYNWEDVVAEYEKLFQRLTTGQGH